MSMKAKASGARPAFAIAPRTREDPKTEELATERTVIKITLLNKDGKTCFPEFVRAMTKGEAFESKDC